MDADSVALYMAAGASREIAATLIAAGKKASTPAIVVENASLRDERRLLTTLEALSRAPLPRAEGPVVLLVGAAFDRAVGNEESAPIFPETQAAS
jgi:uroporphyrin-III C-methyltransferase